MRFTNLSFRATAGQVARLAGIFAGLAGCGLPVFAATAEQGSAVVGEVTLVIGNARVTAHDGSGRDIQRGTELHVGDRIETRAAAHVHIRFVDGARVSVRPGSRLQVEQYAQAGPGSAIKFRLDEGVVRSITGAWGEAARDRFRLNTPVAAIGVKGTDFVVRSSGETTAASVFTGAIVVAPLTGACAVSVGPCSTGTEKLLSADMKGQMLELQRGQAAPRLVPAVDLLALARAGGLDGGADGARAVRAMAADPSRAEAASTDKPVISEGLANATLATAAASAMRPGPEQDLFWVRYPWAYPLAGDDFTRRFDSALNEGSRSLGTDGAFSLQRPESTPYAPPRDSVSFRLTNASAAVVREAGREIEDVRVNNATLSVDFARSTFATTLTASGTKLGVDTIQATGGIDGAGALRSNAGNASVVGGFNGDGSKAGYAFRKAVPAGTLLGVTLWGK